MMSKSDDYIAGFIAPYKCYEVVRRERLDRKKMRVKKGQLRPSPNEEAQMIKEETEKRRKLRLKQVREQSKENAAKIRQSVKHEKHKQLMKLATEIKTQLENEKAERVRHLEQQYDNSLRNIGLGHRDASLQPDWSEERAIVMQAKTLQADARGREAMARLREETSRKMMEAQKINMARKQALEVEKERAASIAAMPPPPPDPISNIHLKPKPVKVTDMNSYSTSHYHLMNEHVVDRAGVQEQTNAREAAELEQERIQERALELKRLRQDQLERARVRHNMALEKELLKYDYNNILHDLSDLQRADRERRLKIVHNIPKQVFEPPNVRMEDREDKQKQMEQEFEDMYMAGTDYMGDISMALQPHPQPETPSGTDSLDITTTTAGTPLQEPTLPAVPPVLRDMTNVPKPRSPGKKPEKVLRSLMDRIKSQREEWKTSHSVLEVGEGEESQLIQSDMNKQGMGEFKTLIPDDSGKELSPPEKLARVTSPIEATAMQPGIKPAPRPRQTNLQVSSSGQIPIEQLGPTSGVPGAPVTVTRGQGVVIDGRSQEIQQIELAEILKQQELILEQKRHVELKLQQLTHHQQNLQASNKLPEQQLQQPPVTGLPPHIHQLAASLSSSTHSNQPMNSIPPTHTTDSVPMTIAYPSQGHMQQIPVTLTSAPFFPQASSNLPTVASIPNGYGPGMTETELPIPGNQGEGKTVAPTTIPVSAPSFVGSLSAEGYSEQMRRVKDYQAYLLARHEQSKRVLAETKAEIKRRRDNLVQRYPKLDLSRLEDLGAKYLENKPGEQLQTEVSMAAPAAGQGQVAFTTAEGQGQGQTVPVTALLASLASHPYYAQTLSQSLSGASVPSGLVNNGTIGAVPIITAQPDINFETNLRKNKFDAIRKSLPFDTDESFQSPNVRIYDAYASKQLDTTAGTETTEADTSTSTERGSPKLKTPSQFQPLPEEESEGDTSTPVSVASDQSDSLNARQEELLKQLADIQRQKEEIMQRHAVGQERVQQKQDQLKAKLATMSTAEQQAQLRDTYRKVVEEKKLETPQPSTSETTVYPSGTTSEEDSPLMFRHQNLSTIIEVETPASTRPSEGTRDRLSMGSTDSRGSIISPKSLEGKFGSKLTPEDGRLDSVETQMQKQEEAGKPGLAQVAAYSGSNIQNILDRAKRFETEVLEKLRKQTNAVLYDRGFDESLEFDVSRRETEALPKHDDGSVELDVRRRQVTAASLSSGSITPDDSLSTGPLNDSDITRSREVQSANGSFQVQRSRDLDSANGSMRSSRSWADELSSYKIPPSNQTELSFKVMKPDVRPDITDKLSKEESMFSDVNRFKVYSAINKSGSSSSESSDERGVIDKEGRTVNAEDMLQHLRNIQQDIKNGEQTRKILERDLADRQTKSQREVSDLSQYSAKSDSQNLKDQILQQDYELSQYSFTSDKSGDKSLLVTKERKAAPVQELPVMSGTSSVQRELPVRKSPIGDLLRSRSPVADADSRQEVTMTDYSFTVSDGKQRSTSTPGEDRSRTLVGKSSELPSDISAGALARTVTGASLSQLEFQTPVIHVTGTETRREQERMVESRRGAPDLSTSSETVSSVKVDKSSSEDQFHTLLPDSQHQSETFGSGLTIDESSQREEFKKLTSFKDKSRIKTYAVTMDGDLVSEHSDSDKSPKTGRHSKDDLTTYSLSSVDEFTKDSLSSVSKDATKSLPISDYSYKSSHPSASDLSERSEESQPKSSSLTNVTSDLSLTGVSNLSQYTVQTDDLTGAPNLTQCTMKSGDVTGAPDLSQYSLKSGDVTRRSEDKSANAADEGSDYLQEKFASLDNLISESKSLIAKHKVLVDKNKQMEEVPKKSSVEEESRSERETAPGVQPLYTQASNVKKFKEWYMSTPGSQAGTESEGSKLSSFSTDSVSPGKDVSSSLNKTGASETTDVNSLEYLVEHGTGITEEPVPDLSTMTLGSELNISEAFNRTEMSDSSDSLKSFEKHEMSSADSESLSSSRTDDIWTSRQSEQSQSDSVQGIIENRRENFQAESRRRAAAAKERALQAHQKKTNGDVVFRAVPVSVVAEPTLSMSAKASGTERGRSPVKADAKSAQSVKDAKQSFEAKAQEVKASTSAPLNRALLPRSARQADAGSTPRESGARPKDQGDKPKPAGAITAADKKKMGALTGEIKSFGGSAGLAAKQPPVKKVPPAVKPKPARPKSTEVAAPQPTSSLSKTLSSWKKSRSLSAPAPSVMETEKQVPAPTNSIKVLPADAPEPLTEEERQQRVDPDNVIYERHMRAYNPRLFRLERQLDTDEVTPTKSPSQGSPRSRSLDRRDSRKRLKDRVKKKARKK